MLRLFVEASVDRIVFVPGDQTSGPGILGVHEPIINARYVLLADLAGPRVLMPLAMSIHFKHMPDQFASHARAGLDLPQQVPALSLYLSVLECLLIQAGISISTLR